MNNPDSTLEAVKASLEIVKAVAWPVTTLIVALMFWRPLSERLGSINTVEAPGLKIDFGQAVRVTERESQAEGVKAEGLSVRVPTEVERLAEVNPAAAVVAAWGQLPKTSEASSGESNASSETFLKLKELGAQVAHGIAKNVTADDAMRYIRLASVVARELRSTKDPQDLAAG